MSTGTFVDRSQRLMITGEGHNVVKQFPMFGKGAPIYWWHEKGYIHWEDARPPGKRPVNYYGLMSWQEFATRVLNLSAMITKSGESGDYADERRRMQQFVADAEPLVRAAREHGGLLDKGASEYHKQRRAKSVVMPKKFPTVVIGGGGVDKLAVGQKKMEDPFKM